MREDAATKGRRYLTEGRLVIVERTERRIVATCRGDGLDHQLGHDANRGWWCSCPVLTRECSHLVALRLVTSVN